MTFLVLVAAFCLCIGPWASAATPASAQALMTAYETAVRADDDQAVLALWELDRKNTELVAQLPAFAQHCRAQAKGVVFSLAPFDREDDPMPMVMDGYKLDWLVPPEGVLKLINATGGAISLPYAKTLGGYKLISQRRTHLNWSGPPDVTLSVSIHSSSPAVPDGPLKIKIRFNASGVRLEKTLHLTEGSQTKSTGWWGQFFEGVEVIENEGPARTFELLSDNRKVVIHKGRIEAATTGIVYAEKAR